MKTTVSKVEHLNGGWGRGGREGGRRIRDDILYLLKV